MYAFHTTDRRRTAVTCRTVVHDAHATTATTHGCFQDDWQAGLLCKCHRLLEGSQRFFRARHHRHTAFQCQCPCLRLVPQRLPWNRQCMNSACWCPLALFISQYCSGMTAPLVVIGIPSPVERCSCECVWQLLLETDRNSLRAWTNEGNALFPTPACEGAVLAEKTVAGMDTVHLLILRELNDALCREVCVLCSEAKQSSGHMRLHKNAKHIQMHWTDSTAPRCQDRL